MKERIEQVKMNLIKSEFLGSKYPDLDESKIRKINIPTLLLEGEKSPKLFHFLYDGFKQRDQLFACIATGLFRIQIYNGVVSSF